MQPSADADATTLLRRVTFDLTGLPPTAEEVEAFVDDPSPAAYRKQVDRLLGSPAFGERMAIYWLDLVRFADTVGYHGDQDHNISPYRDYVIDAFNDDMPFDQFTREQLAGDLLPDPTIDHNASRPATTDCCRRRTRAAFSRRSTWPSTRPTASATCPRCGWVPRSDAPSVTITSTILTRSRTSIRWSRFSRTSTRQQHFKVGSNALPTRRPPEIPVLAQWQQDRLASFQSQLAEHEMALLSSRVEDRAAIEQAIGEFQAELDSIRQSERLTMVTQAIEPREIRVLPRGNWLDDSGPIVQPAVPEFMGRLNPDGRRLNRLDLANWLVDVDKGVGGLTATRVRESALVSDVRTRHLLLLGRFRRPGRTTDPPGVARSACARIHRRRMERQTDDAAARPLADLSAKLGHDDRGAFRRSRQPLVCAAVPLSFAGRDGPRQRLAISGLLVSDVGGSSVKPVSTGRILSAPQFSHTALHT